MIKDTMVMMEVLPELFRFLPKQANHKENIHVDRNITSNMEGGLCRTNKWECQAVEVSPKFGPSLSLSLCWGWPRVLAGLIIGWIFQNSVLICTVWSLKGLFPSCCKSQKLFTQLFFQVNLWSQAPGLSLETAPNPYFSETAISYALTFTFYEIAHWLIDD